MGGAILNGPLIRWGNLALAVGQVAAATLPAALGFGASIPDRSHALDHPGAPADAAFAIWGLIYPALLAYAVYQALPGTRDSALLGRLRGPTALMFAANTAWPITVQGAGLGPPSVALIVVIIAPALVALGRVERARWRPGGGLTRGEQLCVRWPIGLLAGWLTAATFVNLASTIKGAGGLRLGGLALSDTDVALAAIIATAALAASVTALARGSLPYALPVAWALGWIARRNLGPYPNGAVVVVALGMLATLALASLGAVALGRPARADGPPAGGGDMAAGRGEG